MTIIVAVGEKLGPSQVVEVGHDLANRFDDDLVAVHVMPQEAFERRQNSRAGKGGERPYAGVDPELSSEGGNPRTEPYTVDQGGKADAANVARRVVEETLDDSSKVTFEGHVGDPVEKLLLVANQTDARYLVVGGRRRTPIGKAVFGSTTQSVLLNCDRPVLTVPDTTAQTTRTGPVVAAVDRSRQSEEVVSEAADIADATNRDLHVVHVLSKGEFADLERATESGATASEVEIREAAESIAEESAEGFADEFTAVGLVGEPSKRLVEYCDTRDASYAVTAGRRRTPVGKVLFGSVTQSVILTVDCPILTTMAES